MASSPSGRPAWSPPAWARAALVCAALGAWWIATFEHRRSWGWDEAMHAELPAVRMLLTARAGDLDGFFAVLHGCQQYPFGWPLVLAGVQGLCGVSELLARFTGLACWAFCLWGVFLLAQELAQGRRGEGEGPRRGDDLLPWLALAFAALSPLALGYAASLFLEVPAATATVFALRAWLRRSARGGRSASVPRQLAAGAWLCVAFFAKWNYGLLLIGACGLDWLLGLVAARRAGRFWRELHALPFLALPLLLGLGWWLFLPLPYGFETGAEHRRVLFEFLGSNRQLAATPWEQRVLFWSVFLCFSARLFLVELVGLAASLRGLLEPGTRSLWLILLAAGLPVWIHPFHLDRFLIPAAPVLWVLAAAGLAAWLPERPLARLGVLGPVAAAALLFPAFDAPFLARRLGLVRGDAELQQYIVDLLADKHRLGTGRPAWVPGLEPEGAAAILELVTAEVGAGERVGWIGINSELPPAAVHLALLEASGERERFLRDAHRPMDVTFTGADPQWDVERLREFAADYDLFISTDPPDVGGRASRAFVRGYAERLVTELGWRPRQLGTASLEQEGRAPREISVYALRPPAAPGP